MKLDLSELSICSGINYRHLVMMLKGMMIPSDAHLQVLKKTLQNEDLALFDLEEAKKKAPSPTIDAVSVPEGYELIPYCPYEKLEPGDLLAYTGGHSYNSWLEIGEKDPGKSNKIVYTAETNDPIYIVGGRPVRVARRKK